MFVQAVANRELSEFPDPPDDMLTSEAFYKQFKSDSDVLIPKIAPVDDILPGETSILDILIKMSSQQGSWKVPATDTFRSLVTSRQATEKVFLKVRWTQYVLGEESEERLSRLVNWIMNQFERSEQILPVGVIPCAVIGFRIESDAFDKICQPEFRDQTFNVKRVPNDHDGPTDLLPIKLVFGNGHEWTIIFERSVEALEDGTFNIKNIEIPKKFIDFLKKIPAITGYFSPFSAIEIEDWIRKCTADDSFSMNGAVDLQCLARLAGWKCTKTESTILSLVTTGMGYFRFLSWTEAFWAESFRGICNEAQKDVLGSLKMSYAVYATLLYTLLYDTFPDCDIVTQTTRTTAAEFTDYWSSLVISVLNFTIVDREEASRATTRQQLAMSIKYLMEGGETSSDTPYRVKKFTQLIGQWPTLTCGGARFLPVVREHFFSQYEVLKDFPLKDFEYVFSHELSAHHRYYGRFGIKPGVIGKLVLGYPITEIAAELHLVQHPTLQKSTIKIAVQEMSYKTLSTAAKEVGRPMRDVVLEWCRLNVEMIPELFEKLANNPDLNDLFFSYYENIRLLYLNVGKSMPVRVESMEHRMSVNRAKDRSDYESKIERIDASIGELTKHKKAIENALAVMDSDEQRGHRSNRVEHRELVLSVPSLRPYCSRRKPKLKNKTQKTNVPPLSVRKEQHDGNVLAPPPPPGHKTWSEYDGMSQAPPSVNAARKRARSRSAAREEMQTFKGIGRQQRRSRSKSRKPKKANASSEVEDVEPQEVIQVEDSPLRSPSIEIDYSNPDTD